MTMFRVSIFPLLFALATLWTAASAASSPQHLRDVTVPQDLEAARLPRGREPTAPQQQQQQQRQQQHAAGASPEQEGADEVDAFMARVLERREINWSKLYDYVFDEVERFEIQGTQEIAALQSYRHEFVWYVRDGYLVRSPKSVNGITVSQANRVEYEREWIDDIDKGERGTRVERDAFFDFEFEPGNYFFAGLDVFEGRDVVKVEYYPRFLFADKEDEDEEFDHMFDKTSLVTMWIDPEDHQIVKMLFDNVGLEFLPYGWLVRLEDLQASMIMHQPIEDVWLPRELRASASLSSAAGEVSVLYSREFTNYRQTQVGAQVIFGRPKIRR